MPDQTTTATSSASRPESENAVIYATPASAADGYLQGAFEQKMPELRAAFLPDARLFWLENGKSSTLTQLEWWERIRGTPLPSAALKAVVRILDREGPFALVDVVTRREDGTGFHDYLLVVETDRGFRIADKVFRRLGPSDDPTAPQDLAQEATIREVLATKIEAHAAYDPSLLAKSHLPDARGRTIRFEAIAFATSTLSEAAAQYAERRERGETDRESPWRILAVHSDGEIACAKLDVVYQGRRYIDHLLLLRVAEGFRIVGYAWGDPHP